MYSSIRPPPIKAPAGRQVNYVWGISTELKQMLSYCLLIFSIEAWSRCGISIALVIHSIDPLWGLSVFNLRFYTPVAPLGLKTCRMLIVIQIQGVLVS